MSHDIFISYHHADRSFADRICEVLEASDLCCWMAPRDVLPGKEWAESIVDAIEGAKVLVLIFSGQSNDSVQVKREVEQAVRYSVPIIPVRVEPVEPTKTMSYFLGMIHWFDAFGSTFDARLLALVEQVKRLLAIMRATEPQSASQLNDIDADTRVLQELLDQISLAMLTRISKVACNDGEVSRVLRARVLGALPEMDAKQKGILLRCLHLSGLVDQPRPFLDLSGADLSDADLVGAVLPGICLFNVDLTGADLRRANLVGGTLVWACINEVKFEGAQLDGVVVVGNEIQDAGLDPSFLRSLGADIRRPD